MNKYTQKTTKSGLAIVVIKDDPDFRELEQLGLLTEENEHNPLVAATCPKCNGKGSWSVQRGKAHLYLGCKYCDGIGSIDKPERLFKDESKYIEVEPFKVDSIKCPKCGIKFRLADKSRWSGKRHRCGQKIKVKSVTT